MTLMFVLRIALSFVFGILGGILAVQGVDGWGWFLLVAVLSIPSIQREDYE